MSILQGHKTYISVALLILLSVLQGFYQVLDDDTYKVISMALIGATGFGLYDKLDRNLPK